MSQAEKNGDRRQATHSAEGAVESTGEAGFAQSRAHALLIRMFDLRRGGGLGYGALYVLCRVVRAIFHTG